MNIIHYKVDNSVGIGVTTAKNAYVPDGVRKCNPNGKSLTTAKMQTKAMETVTPEATPLTLLGQSSPKSSQGIVPTPAPKTKHPESRMEYLKGIIFLPRMYRMTDNAGQTSNINLNLSTNLRFSSF